MPTPSYLDRCAGTLVGLACGDAVGTTVEFRPRGSFPPVVDMVGGGPFGLRPGQWTDDTSMALCLAESLLAVGGSDAADQMGRYLNWWRWGYQSATGSCFDIGNTVRGALVRFEATGQPFAGLEDPMTAGNGALMRLAPVVLFFFPNLDAVARAAVDSTRTTHGAAEALDCSRLFAQLLAGALAGHSKADLVAARLELGSPKVTELAGGGYLAKGEEELVGSGYSVACLEAALWCFQHTGSFAEAILRAVNLGDDADTTAAVTGQLAGAYYGLGGIPSRWCERLHRGDEIARLGRELGRAGWPAHSG